MTPYDSDAFIFFGATGDLCDLAMPDFHTANASHLVGTERQSQPETTSQEHL